jgi:hypothetical protein
VQIVPSSSALPPVVLHPTLNPITIATLYFNFLKRTPLQFRPSDIDRDGPSWIIDGADFNSELMLPISIATADIKLLQPRNNVNRRHFPSYDQLGGSVHCIKIPSTGPARQIQATSLRATLSRTRSAGG